jgi:tetratricopeptide (TPR) repeat protein
MPHPTRPRSSDNPAGYPQKASTWLVAVRKLGFQAPNEAGESITPYVVIVADMTQELFIAMVPLEKRPTAGQVQEALFGGMRSPADGQLQPYRPTRVEFEQGELVSQLSPALWELEISAAAGQPAPIIDEVVEGLNQAIGGQEPEVPGLLSVPGVTPPIVEGLFEAAGEFYRYSPWDRLSDTDALLVEFHPSREKRIAQVMGEGGIELGLALYQEWGDLLNVYSETDDPLEKVPENGLHALTFVNKKDLPSEDQEALKRYRWKAPNKNAYPMPLVFSKQGAARPDRQEIIFYEALLRAIPKLLEEPLKLDEYAELEPFQISLDVSTTDGPIHLTFSYPAGEFPDDFFQSGLDDEWGFDDDDDDDDDWEETEVVIPLTEAQQKAAKLAGDAWETEDQEERRKLAEEAIKISPDHPDAYLVLAQSTDDPKEAIHWFREGLKAGERLITDEWIEEAGGKIWRIREGESIMSLHSGLADSLVETGQYDEAIEQYYLLLDLDPMDTDDIRFTLLALLLRLNRDQEAGELLEDFDDLMDGYAEYAWALLKFRKEGNSPAARKTLNKAIKYNPFAARMLSGEAPIPVELSSLSADQVEAANLARENYQSWWNTPGAVEWLKKHSR